MRKNEVIPSVHISGFAAEGKAITRIENCVVFVEKAVPGDVADIRITRKKNNYAEATAEIILKKSDLRQEPLCSHFGLCGGCKWQHLSYAAQINFKQQQVKDALEKIGKVPHPELLPIVASKEIYQYRNRLDYTFASNRWLTEQEIKNAAYQPERRGAGFHIPGRFDRIVDIETCHLQVDVSNQIRNHLKTYCIQHDISFYDVRKREGQIRQLIVRTATNGQLMAVVWFNKPDAQNNEVLNNLLDAFPEITSLYFIVNDKINDSTNDVVFEHFAGKAYIEERMEELIFRISPQSFYQTNSNQAYELYKITRDFAEIKPDDLVFDLYTGTGTIALFVAKLAQKVIGVEYVEQAVNDAYLNAKLNAISNCEFFAGDMQMVLNEDFFTKNGIPDVIITDPPRSGMHPDVIERIKAAAPKRLVYVSCNPATQARDLALLNEAYEISAVQPVDMFPHTHHVENVVRLSKRS